MTFKVWNIQTGEAVVSFNYGLSYHGKWAALSPGRRYLMMEHTRGSYNLLCWDLGRGKLVGHTEFQDRKDKWGQAGGLAFSPDGEEVAMLWRLGERPHTWGRLLVWQVKTGKKLFDYKLGYELGSIDSLWFDGGSRCIQWWPQRKGWLLFGHLLIDRDTGAVVHKVGPAPGWSGAIGEHRFLDADHITTITGTFDKQIKVAALPKEKIDAAVKAARAARK
jgi:hypothetical protein